MHLISALVAGIAGAANGTAELYTRGTSTRATYYTDFEGNSANSSGADVDLDANGGATIYVNSTVTVVVKDSDGETVRTFTDGVTASSIEVISDSFTGTDYDDASSGVNKPITLDAVLNKWDDSAGADDWQVNLSGTDMNIDTALGGIYGMFYNVKDPVYGAEGDGSTDDTASIQAAIDAATAANGGTIFFPPGTYRITSSIDVDDEVTVMGAGKNVSIISLDSSSNDDGLIFGNAGATGFEYYRLTGLGFVCAQANSGAFISFTGSYPNITIENCYFHSENISGNIIDGSSQTWFLSIDNCVFWLEEDLSKHIVSESSDLFVRGCYFIGNGTLDGDIVRVDAGHCNITGNVFYNIYGTTSNCISIDTSSAGGSITGNVAKLISQTTSFLELTDESNGTYTVIENGNSIEAGELLYRAALTPASVTSKADKEIIYGSRENRKDARVLSSGGAVTIDSVQYGVYYLEITSAVSITLNTDYIAPEGSRLMLIFQSNNAAPASPTITWGSNFVTAAATFDISARYGIKVFHFVSCATMDTSGNIDLLWQEVSSTEMNWS